jgi:hypothetical protein
VVALAYGVIYATSVLRGEGWMARIRQGNLWMALVVIGLAALWLTPVLNAERISAADQVARFEAGKTTVDTLDIEEIGQWGRPGDAAIAALRAKSEEPGQGALAALFAEGRPSAEGASEEQKAILREKLVRLMPLQPSTATGTRDTLLAAAQDYELSDWISACERTQADGRPGCVMVVADMLPTRPGEEAALMLLRSEKYGEAYGLYLQDDNTLAQRSLIRPNGSYPESDVIWDMMRQFQDASPPLTPAMLNQLGTGEEGLLFLP